MSDGTPARRQAKGIKTQNPVKLKPWDPQIAKEGDDSEQTTFAAVGKALSRWAQYELDLARLFALMTASSPQMTIAPPMLAMGSVRTFEGRAAMLKAVGDWFFDALKFQAVDFTPDYLEAVENWKRNFEELYKSGNQFVARRNEIAHGIVFPRECRVLGYFLAARDVRS